MTTTPKTTTPEIPDLAIEYLPLAEIQFALLNAKGHDEATQRASFERWGMAQAIIRDDRTGRLLAGHGRVEATAAMRDDGEDPPRPGVKLGPDGEWLIAVQVGVVSKDDDDAHALGLAFNRVGEGLWDDRKLAMQLIGLDGPDPLVGTGFDDAALMDVLSSLVKKERTDRETEAADQSDELVESYSVVVTCTDEAHQLELIAQLETEGLECRALVG